MADQIEVEVTGKSIYEVAHQIALNIIHQCENKKLAQINRKEYLNAVVDAVFALRGSRPA
jgi:hypothetical protein